MKTNEVIISKIDKTNPTITMASENITINVGDSNEISSYFTYTANGIAPIKSVTYINISDKNKEAKNTNTLLSGTNVIQCTVTKESGATAVATLTIEVETTDLMPALSYGAYVTNYVAPSGDPDVEWRIFNADESNIYLIADDYIHKNYAPAGKNGSTLYEDDYYGNGYMLSLENVYKDYKGANDIIDPRITKWISYLTAQPSSTSDAIRAVAFILDTEVWGAKYANTEYADYAIGGPTLELWCDSYKKTHAGKYIEWTIFDEIGYRLRWNTDSLYYESIYNIDDGYDELYSTYDTMWLASPASYYGNYLISLSNHSDPIYGINLDASYLTNKFGFQPIVCLKSDVQLVKQSDGTYLIK